MNGDSLCSPKLIEVSSDTHPPGRCRSSIDLIGTCLSPLPGPRGWKAHQPPYIFRRPNVTANSLQELYVEQLQDLYSAEQQIIKSLPKMIDAAQSDELRNALKEH